MKKAFHVLCQVYLNHINAMDWRGYGLISRASARRWWGKAGILPSGGGEFRNGGAQRGARNFWNSEVEAGINRLPLPFFYF